MAVDDEDEWDDAFAAEKVASQESANEMAEACQMMSDSESDDESSESTNHGFASPWWARELYQAVVRLGYAWPKEYSKMDDPIQVISGCTGCSAESAVLKASHCGPAGEREIQCK